MQLLNVFYLFKFWYQLSDWYSVRRGDVVKRGGRKLFKYYSSLVVALPAIFKDFNWELDKFNRLPTGYLTDINNQRNFLDKIGKQLGINQVCIEILMYFK